MVTGGNMFIFGYGCSRLIEQELSSFWDGRPFGHNRYGPKSGGCCPPPLFWGAWGLGPNL